MPPSHSISGRRRVRIDECHGTRTRVPAGLSGLSTPTVHRCPLAASQFAFFAGGLPANRDQSSQLQDHRQHGFRAAQKWPYQLDLTGGGQIRTADPRAQGRFRPWAEVTYLQLLMCYSGGPAGGKSLKLEWLETLSYAGTVPNQDQCQRRLRFSAAFPAHSRSAFTVGSELLIEVG